MANCKNCRKQVNPNKQYLYIDSENIYCNDCMDMASEKLLKKKNNLISIPQCPFIYCGNKEITKIEYTIFDRVMGFSAPHIGYDRYECQKCNSIFQYKKENLWKIAVKLVHINVL